MLRSPKVGYVKARQDQNVKENSPAVRRFVAGPSARQGITRKLDFDDQETLTLIPTDAHMKDVVAPTLDDLLREFAAYMASVRTVAGGREGNGSRSHVSLNLSPQQSDAVVLPKRNNRVHVSVEEGIDFTDSPAPKFDGHVSDEPCRSQFKLKEVSRRARPALRSRGLAELPRRSGTSRDGGEAAMRTTSDARFSAEHSLIRGNNGGGNLSRSEFDERGIELPLMLEISKIAKQLPVSIVKQIMAEISQQMGAFAAVRIGANIPDDQYSKVAARFFANEALAVVLTKIVESTKQAATIRRIVGDLEAREQAAATAPIVSMTDVDKMIGKLKNPRADGVEKGEEYARLQDMLPFVVTRLTNTHVGTSGTAFVGPEKIVVNSLTGVSLHVKIAIDQRFRRFRGEFLEIMRKVPDVAFVDYTLSFVISSVQRRIRFAVVMKVPSHYPWCRCIISYVRVDFGGNTAETLEIVKGIASATPMGVNYLTRFIDALQDRFQT